MWEKKVNVNFTKDKLKANIFIFAKTKNKTMEQFINIHIEKLPEGFYLATSEEIQGLVAQGRTITETLEIARDVARIILESKTEKEKKKKEFTLPIKNGFDYPLVIAY